MLQQLNILGLPRRGGQRNLLDNPELSGLARSSRVLEVVESVLGPGAFPVRGLLFDKTTQANWKVTWHQDLMIAVKERRETPGYGPWSVKGGVAHVQPPAGVLEHMLAFRLHMDPCGADNGPLRVLPGSHRAGKIAESAVGEWRGRITEHICMVPRGGVLLMRPLLLHASSPATAPRHRRVLHIEYANCKLAGGLDWRWAELPARGAV